MWQVTKTSFEEHKGFMLVLLNFMLFPYVLGHFDNRDFACEFTVVKQNCTAFRRIGDGQWQLHNPKTAVNNHVSIISPRNSDWEHFDFGSFKDIFEKEQFKHPIRAAMIEMICRF